MAISKNIPSGLSKARVPKKLKCKLCGDVVNNVDERATAVTCPECVKKIP